MDYKAVASAIAKLGMNGDTELIHVNSSELAQIQKHFGRLPNINPHTGLKSFDDGGDSDSDHGGDPGGGGDSPSEHGGGFGGHDSNGPGGHDASDSDRSENADDRGVSRDGDSPSEHGNGPGSSPAGDVAEVDTQNIHDVNPDDFSVDMAKYKDFTENFNMPNTDLFSRGISALTGITLGHNALGEFGVSVDFNVGSLAGLVGGPVAGYLGKTATDLAGVPHAGFTLNEHGLHFSTDAPDPLNDTSLASAISRGANDLGFTTGVNSMDKTKTGSIADLAGIGSKSSDQSAENTPAGNDKGTDNNNPTKQIADLTSENAYLQTQNANLASAKAFSAASISPFNGTGTGSAIAPFDFNNMNLALAGNMTQSEIQHNKEATNRKKMFRLGDFIQNVAQTALAAPAAPFSGQTSLITPTAFISPTQFT